MATSQQGRLISDDDNQTDGGEGANLPNSSEAAGKAFAVAELLEAVLLQLPLKDILIAQRVGTAWRDAVRNSIHLQRALFLEPEPDSGILMLFNSRKYAREQDLNENGEDYATTHRLNPMIFDRVHVVRRHSNPFVYGPLVFGDFLMQSRTSPRTWDRGAYERMFLTQPPVKSAVVFDLGANLAHTRIVNENGIRLQDVIEPGPQTTKEGPFLPPRLSHYMSLHCEHQLLLSSEHWDLAYAKAMASASDQKTGSDRNES